MRVYILDAAGRPVLTTLAVWAAWCRDPSRRIVAQEQPIPDVWVSTVFLCFDQSYAEGVSTLWETMIFGGQHNHYRARYATLEAAKAGHRRAVELVIEGV